MHNLRSHFLPATFFPLKRAKIKLQQWIKINRLRMHVIIQTRDARFYIFLFVYKTWDVDIHGQQYEKAMLRFTPFLNKAQWIFNFFSLVIQCSTINKSHITGFGWPYLPIGITVHLSVHQKKQILVNTFPPPQGLIGLAAKPPNSLSEPQPPLLQALSPPTGPQPPL